MELRTPLLKNRVARFRAFVEVTIFDPSNAVSVGDNQDVLNEPREWIGFNDGVSFPLAFVGGKRLIKHVTRRRRRYGLHR
jgi:hypothetical protein